MAKTNAYLLLLTALAVIAAIYFALFYDPVDRPGETRGPFGKGRQAVTEGRYQDAARLLDKYLADYPSGRNTSRAHFFLAKAQLGLGNVQRARGTFEYVIATYPDSLEAHKSRYKLGLMDLTEGKLPDARRRFAELVRSPNGPLVPEAKMMQDYLESFEK